MKVRRSSTKSETWHWVFRGVAGLVIFVIGITGWTPGLRVDQALRVSIVVLGVFVLFHLVIDLAWTKILSNKLNLVLDPSSLVQLVGALLTAPTVVVGLLAVFHQPLPLAVKVGAVSLAFGVLMGFILFGLVTAEIKQSQAYAAPPATPTQPPDATDIFRSYIFDVTLWLVAFGLLCITFGLVVS